MNFKMIAAGAAALLLTCSASAEEWKATGDAIKTKWAEKVDPSAPLPEYPRPQMVRSQWVNLNGLWDYAITPAEAEDFSAEGKILVPFAVESSLSGVGRKVGKDQALWYEPRAKGIRRHRIIPQRSSFAITRTMTTRFVNSFGRMKKRSRT